ncbi:MAG TPA: hypothetical protein VF623_05045 [Segetibacter sp.]|jgi:hypothetical protein
MKKLLTLILAVLYFTASSGVVLNVHYCMGKVSSVKVENLTASFCKCGKKESKRSCCSSEFKVVKLSGEYKATASTVNINVPVAVLPVRVSLIDISKITSQAIATPVANAPPPDLPGKIYIENRVFRI